MEKIGLWKKRKKIFLHDKLNHFFIYMIRNPNRTAHLHSHDVPAISRKRKKKKISKRSLKYRLILFKVIFNRALQEDLILSHSEKINAVTYIFICYLSPSTAWLSALIALFNLVGHSPSKLKHGISYLAPRKICSHNSVPPSPFFSRRCFYILKRFLKLEGETVF